MAGLFKKLFDIERHELARALLMFLYGFLLLSAYLILKPVRNSLFLDKFGADQLVYIAPSRVNLQLTEERWPAIRFAATRETLLFAEEPVRIAVWFFR